MMFKKTSKMIQKICDMLKKSNCMTGNVYFTTDDNVQIACLEDYITVKFYIPFENLAEHEQTQIKLARIAARSKDA